MKMLGPIWKSAHSIWSTIKGTSDQGSPNMPNIADVIRHHVFDRPVQDRHFSEAGRRQLKQCAKRRSRRACWAWQLRPPGSYQKQIQ